MGKHHRQIVIAIKIAELAPELEYDLTYASFPQAIHPGNPPGQSTRDGLRSCQNSNITFVPQGIMSRKTPHIETHCILTIPIFLPFTSGFSLRKLFGLG